MSLFVFGFFGGGEGGGVAVFIVRMFLLFGGEGVAVLMFRVCVLFLFSVCLSLACL